MVFFLFIYLIWKKDKFLSKPIAFEKLLKIIEYLIVSYWKVIFEKH